MTDLCIIVAITRSGAIGRRGDMICHLRSDLRRFKALTMGCPVIMGRRTFQSLPKGALPGRRNIVVSRSPEFSAPGVEVFPSLEAAIEAVASAPKAFIIGGGEIYRQAMPLATSLEITHIDLDAPADADTFFPDIDPALWHLNSLSDPITDPAPTPHTNSVTNSNPSTCSDPAPLTYRFASYTRIPLTSS